MTTCALRKGRDGLLIFFNSQFSPRTITQSSISSLNYENDRFGPTQIRLWLIAKYPFYPSPTATRCLLLAVGGIHCSLCSSLSLSSPRRSAPPVWRPAATQNPPRRHLLLRRQAQILGAAMKKACHGWGVGVLGDGGTRPRLHLWGGRPTTSICQQQAVRRDMRRVKRAFGYRAGMNLSRIRKFEDQNNHFHSSKTKLSRLRKFENLKRLFL
jgi:hypothetical protein